MNRLRTGWVDIELMHDMFSLGEFTVGSTVNDLSMSYFGGVQSVSEYEWFVQFPDEAAADTRPMDAVKLNKLLRGGSDG